jgi:hypothetical protein
MCRPVSTAGPTQCRLGAQRCQDERWRWRGANSQLMLLITRVMAFLNGRVYRPGCVGLVGFQDRLVVMGLDLGDRSLRGRLGSGPPHGHADEPT